MPDILNSKATENVNCWICDHFQRYFQEGRGRNGSPPCDGECRFNAPEAISFGQFNLLIQDIWQFFPFIANAPFVWCSKFERSFEQNIPAPVLNPQATGCEIPAQIPEDWQWFWQGDQGPPNFWNKKILPGYVDSPEKGIGCWNCDNWEASALGGPGGTCQYNPPLPFEEGEKMGNDFWLLPRWPMFNNGVCVWCARWQRARHTVTPPDTWDCPQGGL